MREGWRADRLLREPGSFLIFDPPEHTQPVPARCFLMSDEAVRSALAACKDSRPQLDATTAGAVLGRVAQPESDETTSQDPQTVLLEALERVRPESLTSGELERTCQHLRSRAWVQQRLKELESRGVVKRLERGRWAVV